jgi:hypothetical protein
VTLVESVGYQSENCCVSQACAFNSRLYAESINSDLLLDLWLLFHGDHSLDIEILRVEGVFLDELAAGLDGVTHEHGEN